jgi:hypothetical protein
MAPNSLFISALLLSACSFIDAGEYNARMDQDGDGVRVGIDCDDNDPLVKDYYFYMDADLDGWGTSKDARACKPGDGYIAKVGDCDDSDPLINPTAQESCNGVDQDCDGLVDDNVGSAWWPDEDQDGFGDPGTDKMVVQCDGPRGYVDNGSDCNDEDADVLASKAYYQDLDGDGYGNPLAMQMLCPDEVLRAGGSMVDDSGDCDDQRDWIHPGGKEICDANNDDEDCNGLSDDADDDVDQSTFTTWYADADGDGLGNEADSMDACDAEGCSVTCVDNFGDCDDEDPAVNNENCTWRSIASGDKFTCGIDRNYALHCWGDDIANTANTKPKRGLDGVGVLDTGSDAHFSVEGTWSMISASNSLTKAVCAIGLDDGAVGCWAGNRDGDYNHLIGDNLPEGEFVDVDVSGTKACGLTVDNKVKCWGEYDKAPASSQQTITKLEVTEGKACRLMDDGTVNCWWDAGSSDGPLTGSGYSQIGVTISDVCGLKASNGSIKCRVTTPPSASPYVFLSVGFEDGLAVRQSGQIDCWGEHDSLKSQCQTLPQDGDWTELSMGNTHVCGLHGDGDVHCVDEDTQGCTLYGHCTPPVLVF